MNPLFRLLALTVDTCQDVRRPKLAHGGRNFNIPGSFRLPPTGTRMPWHFLESSASRSPSDEKLPPNGGWVRVSKTFRGANLLSQLNIGSGSIHK